MSRREAWLSALIVFAVAFAVGSALAGLGGALSINLLGLDPSFPVKYLVYLLFVVEVGGLASIKGTLAGALVLGVSDVGGKQPDDFETIVRRYVAVSPFAKQTLATKSRALSALMKALLARAPDPASIRRQLELPTIANAKLGADSESWLSTHHPDWVGRGGAPTLARVATGPGW